MIEPNPSQAAPAEHPASRPAGALAPLLIGDHPALDFVNSCAQPGAVMIEWLNSGQAALDWMMAAGLLARGEHDRILTLWPQAGLDAFAREARALREWLRALLPLLQLAGPSALPAAAIDRLNALLDHGQVRYRLAAAAASAHYPHEFNAARHRTPRQRARSAAAMRLEPRRTLEVPADLLAIIAFQFTRLALEIDRNLIRRCENPHCTLWFHDRTKGHGRRWCSQKMCGNRAKVAAFRARKREAAAQGGGD